MAQPYERSPTRQRQIVEAALALLAQEGLQAVTTRRIAERIGLTEGALFRHFPNKQAILLAGLDHLEGLMFDSVAPPEAAAHEPALARLERFFRHRVALVAGPTALGHLVFSEQLVHATGELGRQRIASWRERSAAFVRTCLVELAEAGRLRRGFSPAMLLPLVQGQVLGFVADRVVAPLSRRPLEARVEEAWALLRAIVLEPEASVPQQSAPEGDPSRAPPKRRDGARRDT